MLHSLGKVRPLKFQTKVFLTEVFLNPPKVMDVSIFGSWTFTEMLVFQDFEGLTEVFAP